MKYKTIEIKPRKDNWEINLHLQDEERVRVKTYPNAMGFYHYPQSIDDKKAFSTLKNCMIKAHKDEIERLEKSLKNLIELAL